MGVIKDLKEMGQQFTQELPPEENDRMGYKCVAIVLSMGAVAMGVEAGIDWASQGTPFNHQTIGSTAIALVMAVGSKISWRIGHRSQEAATTNQ